MQEHRRRSMVLDKDGFVDTRAIFERHDESTCGRAVIMQGAPPQHKADGSRQGLRNRPDLALDTYSSERDR